MSWAVTFEQMDRFQTEKTPIELTQVQLGMLLLIVKNWRRDVNDNDKLAELEEALRTAYSR